MLFHPQIVDPRLNLQAVAREWFGNGVPPPVEGRLEFVQDTGMSVTHSLVELRGLQMEASGYHVHQIPVQVDAFLDHIGSYIPTELITNPVSANAIFPVHS